MRDLSKVSQPLSDKTEIQVWTCLTLIPILLPPESLSSAQMWSSALSKAGPAGPGLLTRGTEACGVCFKGQGDLEIS